MPFGVLGMQEPLLSVWFNRYACRRFQELFLHSRYSLGIPTLHVEHTLSSIVVVEQVEYFSESLEVDDLPLPQEPQGIGYIRIV